MKVGKQRSIHERYSTPDMCVRCQSPAQLRNLMECEVNTTLAIEMRNSTYWLARTVAQTDWRMETQHGPVCAFEPGQLCQSFLGAAVTNILILYPHRGEVPRERVLGIGLCPGSNETGELVFVDLDSM
jgi:hypothetical protein